MKFTSDYIKRARMAALFLGEPACTEFREALDEITRLQEQLRWIPVSEKLPEKAGYYFLHIQNGNSRSYERVGLYFIEGKFDVFFDTVTHWKYLPQPPEEK